ncbi:heterokaryon incompatibility protein-domain-containing protein [Aspergillus ambiguus]|uniref:heterokaryon incompatibility protein-domain-containing protein n=1 Tax=Aspergillus ambiguus TaxID=176160 RepID=UPI003CCE15E6
MDKASRPPLPSPTVFLPVHGGPQPAERRAPQTSASWPKTIDLLPDGQLQALVHHHEESSMVSGRLPCWTYISKGLQKLGQKEVIFTVRRRAAIEAVTDFPPGPLEWFQILHSLALSGQIVDQFSQTNFVEPPPLLDRLGIRLIIYYPPLEIRNVPPSIMPQDRLHAIPLTASEAKVAQSYGVMRIISHLGSSERRFPVVPWIDRDRRDCITMRQMEGSVRDRLPMYSFVGISCVQRGSDITLHIPSSAEDELTAKVEALPTSTVISLDCFPYEKSDSGMVWHQGITPSPRAYGIGLSCINFGFIIFCPEQDGDELERVEDGIFLFLTDLTWLRIRKAILQRNPLQIAFGNMQLSLEYDAHASQTRESKKAERATPLFPYARRPPQWALQLTGDAPLPKPPTYQIPIEPFSPEHCALDLRSNAHVKHLSEDSIKRLTPVRTSLLKLRMDQEKGCDKCDILYRAIKAHLPFVDQEHDVVLHFATKKVGLICAVQSRGGLAPILEFSVPDEKCHWLMPNNLATSPEVSIDGLAEVQHWVSSCRSSHSACINQCELEPPIRVLDLGTVDQNQRIRLCEPKISGEPYSTLSHCWNFHDGITTTKGRFHEYTTLGIEVPQLPQPVQVAIQVLRYLKIRYLWVDALCIIQDDDNDWKSQAAKIEEIYKASDITIAVSGSGSCAEGCFMNGGFKYPVRKLRWPGVGGLGDYVVEAGYSLIHTPFYEGMKREEHLTMLHRVSSVHQERWFSSRTLYVGADELVYKCRETCQCECGFQIRY